MPLENINHILLILSGKGGVGKSSITTQLALTLSLRGHAVGVLDVDLTGPSIPRFFGLENAKVTQAPGGLVPVNVHQERKADGGISFGRLDVLSLGFILSTRNTAVIWRGPKKTAMVRQFLTSTLWPRLDYLLIDTPPGTSDEHISLLETLLRETSLDPPHTSNGAGTGSSSKPHLAGAILVTTPQAISTSDVRKELSFCRQTGTPMLGIIENMSGYVCPHCAECTYIFSRGGGEAMAQEFEVPYLGALPLDAAWGELIETGKRPEYPDGTKEAVGARSQERQDGEGTSGSEAANARNGEADRSAEGRDPAEKDEKGECLVEKYTDCSLYPLMKAIVEKALGTSSTQSTNGSSSTAVAR